MNYKEKEKLDLLMLLNDSRVESLRELYEGYIIEKKGKHSVETFWDFLVSYISFFIECYGSKNVYLDPIARNILLTLPEMYKEFPNVL